MTKFAVAVLLALIVAVPAFGKTYKTTYPVACSQVWSSVKDTLSNADNYTVDSSDDAQMTAAYQVKHQAHVNITGAILQRTNKVTLETKDAGCEMRVVSNYSGWEHNDRGDFQQRVEDAMARQKNAAAAAKPAEAAK